MNPQNERYLLWLLAFIQFTVIMDFMVMMPLGPQIMNAFHILPAAFAIAVSSYSLCSGASGLLAATYVDRYDRRTLLLIVYSLFLLSNAFCALSASFHQLLVARACAGLTGGILSSIVMVIVGDVIPAERRGEAMGTVMTSFSMAAVVGVPIGIILGAHWGWAMPFYLLTVFSLMIWGCAYAWVPSLFQHRAMVAPSLSQTMSQFKELISEKHHIKAFVLSIVVMVSQMMVIPFISPVLVANYGINPAQISWIYMAGGIATFFTSRWVGRLSDQYGKRYIFRCLGLFSVLPVLFITHLPPLSLLGMMLSFPFFMVSVSGRTIPVQALLTTVPKPALRGAFMSMNSALQAIGSGCGAWIGGLFLETALNGHILHYGTNGWVASLLILFALWWVGYVGDKTIH
jgi:MFS transporter, DHA1 family, inner membrane transport protein